jgi:hypothetical protein
MKGEKVDLGVRQETEGVGKCDSVVVVVDDEE